MTKRPFFSWSVCLIVALFLAKAAVGAYALGGVEAAARWTAEGLETVASAVGIAQRGSAAAEADAAAPTFVAALGITSLETAVTENFNGLPSTGPSPAWTDDSTLSGVYAAQPNPSPTPGSSLPTVIQVGTGSGTTGGLYSFGNTTATSDRALGSLNSNATGAFHYAVRFVNNTGAEIRGVTVSYVGEQYKLNNNATAQKLDFQYQAASAGTITDANSPSTGWTDVDSLDFTGPQASATTSTLDGNAAANRTAKSASFAVTVADGAELWLKWIDANDSGNDHALAVDDLSVTAFALPETTIDSTTIDGTSATFTFSSNSSAATFQCSVDSGSWETCASPYNIQNLADGGHTFDVKAVNPAGEDASPATHAWTVSTGSGTPTPSATPETTITSSPTDPSASTSATFVFSADIGGSSFECKLDDGSWAACVSPKTYSALSEGDHSFEVRATAGSNTDPTPATFSWTIDLAPETTISVQPGSTTLSTSADFAFTSDDGDATFECKLDSGSFESCSSPASYSSLSNGSHTFSVRAVDVGGTSDASPATVTWTVAKPNSFGASNLLVFRAASATSSNTTGSLVELNKTSASQTAVQTVDLDSSGPLSLRFSGSSTSSAYLSRSNDGASLLLTGHASTTSTGNANTLLTRGVGMLGSDGTFSIATTYTGASGNQTRSATTVDGSVFFITDSGGLFTNSALLPDPVGNFRAAKSFGGTVYVGGTNTSLAPVVTIASATGAAATSLAGLPLASGGDADFFLISSGETGAVYDVLYFLRTTSATVGAIHKYSLVDGTWVSNGSYTTAFGGFGLAAEDNGTGALLYMTTGNGATAANSVRRVADTAGYNQTISVTTADIVTLYTAPAGTTLKGIALAPAPFENRQPVIVPAEVSVAKGSAATSETIGSVGDLDTGPSSVTVTVVGDSTSNGVTISNVQRTGGALTADIETTCTATAATFTLEADDGSATSTQTLTVTPTADTNPTLTYASADTSEGGSVTVSPATGPSDNGSVSSVAIQSQGTYTGTVSVNSAGEVSISNAGPAGTHTITVRVTDACGNSTDATLELTVADITPPSTTITSNPPSATRSSSASFSFTASEPGSTFECSLDSSAFTACTSPVSYTGLEVGSHTFRVRGRDSVGNLNPVATAYTWVVDLTGPTFAPFSPLLHTTSTGARSLFPNVSDPAGVQSVSVTYSVSAPPSYDGEVDLGPSATVACIPSSGSQYVCTIPGVPTGRSVSYYLTATDVPGNSVNYPDPSAPLIYTVGNAPIPAGTYSRLLVDWFTTFSGDVKVVEGVTISGEVNLGAHKFVLGCDATVSGAGSSSFFVGKLEKEYCGPGTFTFPVGAVVLPAVEGEGIVMAPTSISTYTPVIANVTAGTFPSSLTVTVFGNQIGGTVPGEGLRKYWDVTEFGDITADITFQYLDADIQGNESLYQVIRRSGGISQVFGAGSVDAVNNRFTALNVSEFSEWSAALPLSPTSAGAEISGRVVSERGTPLKGVLVTVSGGGLLEPMIVRTNVFGAYRFENLKVGETYVVQALSGRYIFRNPSRLVQLYESLSNETFVGTPR